MSVVGSDKLCSDNFSIIKYRHRCSFLHGKDHYAITTFSWQKIAEGEYYGSLQISKITIMILFQLCAVFIMSSIISMSHGIIRFFMRIIGTFFKN